MTTGARIAFATAAGALLSVGAPGARATCGLPGTVFTSSYYDAPIGQDPDLTKGSFWGLGHFDPAHPGGTDNGDVPSSTWLYYTQTVGFYLAGDWSMYSYDGCIQDPPNPQPATMAAMWTTSDGNDSYYVAMCAVEDEFGGFNSFVQIPDGPMFRVPKAVIHQISRAPNTVNISVGHQPLAGSGVYRQGGCPLAVTGFKVFQRSVPRNAPAPNGPGSRSPESGWTLLGEGPEGADVIGQASCEGDTDIYLMIALVLDGNVALQQGSRNSTRVECGPNLATPSGDGAGMNRQPRSRFIPWSAPPWVPLARIAADFASVYPAWTPQSMKDARFDVDDARETS